jgi:hypothetical protein
VGLDTSASRFVPVGQAGEAIPGTVAEPAGIFRRVRMTPRTFGFPGVGVGRAVGIDTAWDRFEVGRSDAGPMRTRRASLAGCVQVVAKVIDRHAFGDRANEKFVDRPVDGGELAPEAGAGIPGTFKLSTPPITSAVGPWDDESKDPRAVVAANLRRNRGSRVAPIPPMSVAPTAAVVGPKASEDGAALLSVYLNNRVAVFTPIRVVGDAPATSVVSLVAAGDGAGRLFHVGSFRQDPAKPPNVPALRGRSHSTVWSFVS